MSTSAKRRQTTLDVFVTKPKTEAASSHATAVARLGTHEAMLTGVEAARLDAVHDRNVLLQSDNATFPQRLAAWLQRHGDDVVVLTGRSLATALHIEGCDYEQTLKVARASKVQQMHSKIQTACALIVTGTQVQTTLQQGDLRRIEFFVRKLRACSAAADTKDHPWGGIRVVIVASLASGSELWATLREAASGRDLPLQSVLDRLHLENVVLSQAELEAPTVKAPREQAPHERASHQQTPRTDDTPMRSTTTLCASRSSLPAEQIARAEANRQRALERRARLNDGLTHH